MDKRKRLEEEEKEKKEAEKLLKKEEHKAKGKKKDKKVKEKNMNESLLNLAFSLFGGLKVEVKRIHFRYEDDIFQSSRPFAFGLMIDSFTLDNSDTDWVFDSA